MMKTKTDEKTNEIAITNGKSRMHMNGIEIEKEVMWLIRNTSREFCGDKGGGKYSRRIL